MKYYLNRGRKRKRQKEKKIERFMKYEDLIREVIHYKYNNKLKRLVISKMLQ